MRKITDEDDNGECRKMNKSLKKNKVLEMVAFRQLVAFVYLKKTTFVSVRTEFFSIT